MLSQTAAVKRRKGDHKEFVNPKIGRIVDATAAERIQMKVMRESCSREKRVVKEGKPALS
jgi:hypothetical protein